MGQLIEMARFREPEEPTVIAECCQCEAELYKGQTVTEVDTGVYVCDSICYVDYMKPTYIQL